MEDNVEFLLNELKVLKEENTTFKSKITKGKMKKAIVEEELTNYRRK